MHPALLNGRPKATIIESFDRQVSIIRPGFRRACKSLEEAQTFILERDWEINIEIIKGSPILRRIQG